MPANDTYWWNQKTLNIVFALSSFVMLLSVILMMQKDHDDEWRPIQRKNFQLEAKIDEVQLTAIEDDTFKAQTGALLQQIGASAAALKKTKAEPGNAELFSTLDAQQRVVDRLEVDLKSKNALRDEARAVYDLGVRDALPADAATQSMAFFESRQQICDEAPS